MSKRTDRIGEIQESANCGMMKIIEYNNANDIKVEFVETKAVVGATYHFFKKGLVKDHLYYGHKRVGEINESNYWGPMEIINYHDTFNVDIKFLNTGTIVTRRYERFKDGNIKDPLGKSVFDVGYMGIGKYKSKNNNINTKNYNVWHSMISRCYSNYTLNLQPAYIDKTVCKEWLNFQTFSVWFFDNYYEIPNEIMHLDKDCIMKGNTEYCPIMCNFIPATINSLLVKSDSIRGKYPIGVSLNNQCNPNKYSATMRVDKVSTFIGNFNTKLEAFEAYKQAKESQIKVMADRYKEYLPSRVYEALYNYQVNIID